MNEIFESLINSYINGKVGIAEDFLGRILAKQLSQNLNNHFHNNELKPAGIGNMNGVTNNRNIRSDKIYWLDRKHNDPYENEFFDIIDLFIRFLNETCYTGITGYEFHYALYEKGSFYLKHLDTFRSDDSRLFSMITYLNPDWEIGDGGELCIHHDDGSKQNIPPISGKSVFFNSRELAHEVLVTHRSRLSITGWLKK